MSYNIDAFIEEWREQDPYLRDWKGFIKYLSNQIKQKTIYLTDQLLGHPDIKGISREIMVSVADFYKRPLNAIGYRSQFFTDAHRPAWDSGGFQFLMGKLTHPDPLKTIAVYKAVGVEKYDFPIQLDLPPRYGLSNEEVMGLIKRGAEFYHIMAAEIPNTVAVIHGWKRKQLETSLLLIEDPDRLATATNIPTYARTLDKMTRASGTNLTVTGGSQYILDHVTSDKSHVAAPGGDVSTYVIDHLKNKEARALAVGTNIPITSEKSWTMGHLNPHSSVVDRLAIGAYQQSGMFVCDHIANTPRRMERKAIASGIMAQSPVVVDNVISSKPRTDVVAAGGYQQSGMYVLDYAGNLKKTTKVIATPAAAAEEIQDTIESAQRKRKKRVVSATAAEAEQRGGYGKIPKKHRAPQDVVLKRLAMVLNMLRDKELFILGGASPHFQHILFCGGAKYSDTSSWRLKAYMASIYLPEIGARAIGYKETDPRLKQDEVPILRECLRDPTHPFSGMSVHRFLELGHMNVAGYYKTLVEKEWPAKPFDLRALHNAWVLKVKEEEIANEYANDPDRYYDYLMNKRFEGHPILARRLRKVWMYMKQPYVQDETTIYLKGRRV